MDMLLIIVILGVAVIMAITSVLLAKIRQHDPKHYKSEAEYWETQAKMYKGKANAAKKRIEIEGDYDLENTDDISAAIGGIGDALEGVLPDSVRKLIKDPKLMNMVVGYAEKHPELAKKVIDGFIKKSKGGNTTGQIENTEDAA